MQNILTNPLTDVNSLSLSPLLSTPSFSNIFNFILISNIHNKLLLKITLLVKLNQIMPPKWQIIQVIVLFLQQTRKLIDIPTGLGGTSPFLVSSQY